MANVVVTSAAPVVVPSTPYIHPAQKHAKTFKLLGIIQVVVGTLSIIFAAVAMGVQGGSYYNFYGYYYYNTSLTYVAAGIWAGVFAIVAGVLGIACGKTVDSCKITASVIMTVFAAIAAGLMFSIETPAAVYSQYGNTTIYAMHILLSILSFIELVVAIAHSAYSCAGGCCSTTQGSVMPPMQTVVTTTHYPNQMQVTAIPGQQQQMYAVNQGYVVGQQQYVQQQQQFVAQPQQQFVAQPQQQFAPQAQQQFVPQQNMNAAVYANDPPQYTQKA